MLRKTVCAIVSAFVLTTGMSVGAAGSFSSVVSYNPELGEVKVSGVASKGTVTVMIVPQSTSIEELNENSLPVFFRPFETDGGEYSFIAGMPEDADGGKYKVYVTNNGEKYEDNFVYMNIAKGEEVVSLLNGKDGKEFSDLLEANAVNLGIDTEDAGYIAKKTRICELLDKMSFADIYDFYGKYSTAYAVCMIEDEENTETVKTIIRKFADILGIDYDADFDKDERLTEDTKNELLSLLAGTDFSKESDSSGDINFKNIMSGLKSLAAVRCVENWMGIKTIVTEDFKDEFENMLASSSKYQQIKDKDLVYSEMIKTSFSSLEDVETAFDKAVNKVFSSENQSSSSGSSPGGGKVSGGSMAMITTPPASQLEIESDTNSGSSYGFTDIDESHWAYGAVTALAEKGVISGYDDGSFRASAPITRAEFTKMILTYAKDIPLSDTVSFDDVSESSWYYNAVIEAASKGLVSGNGTGFSPDSYIKREDAALIIYRLLNLLEKNPRGYRPFADRKEISEYAKDAVYTLGGAYIVNGDEDNMFHPQNSITRAESAQLIYNALEKF